MIKVAALTLILSACASVPFGSPARNVTLASPEQAARIAANVFARHDFPVRRSGATLIVATGPFDARRVWTPTELAANVDCKPPKKNANPDGHVTLQITASGRAYHEIVMAGGAPPRTTTGAL